MFFKSNNTFEIQACCLLKYFIKTNKTLFLKLYINLSIWQPIYYGEFILFLLNWSLQFWTCLFTQFFIWKSSISVELKHKFLNKYHEVNFCLLIPMLNEEKIDLGKSSKWFENDIQWNPLKPVPSIGSINWSTLDLEFFQKKNCLDRLKILLSKMLKQQTNVSTPKESCSLTPENVMFFSNFKFLLFGQVF
jgi:hypothetical protein